MIIVCGCRMKLRRSAVLRHKDQADGHDRRRVADGRAAGDGALPRGELRVAAICGAAVMSAGGAGGRFAEPPPEAQAIFSRRSRLGANREPRTANRDRRKPELPPNCRTTRWAWSA